jgi:hypothetical protein
MTHHLIIGDAQVSHFDIVLIAIYEIYNKKENGDSSPSLGRGEASECELLVVCLCTILTPNYNYHSSRFVFVDMIVNLT